MLRLAFLLLVVVGALAAVLALAVGAGVWRAASLRADGGAAARPAVPDSVARPTGLARPPTQPAAMRPTDPPPLPADEPQRPPADRGVADPDRFDPPPPPARLRPPGPARVPPPAIGDIAPARPFRPDVDVPPIVLAAADAKVQGTDLKVEGGDVRAAVDWRNVTDSLSWEVDVPRTGVYQVEVEYACDPRAGGGAYWLTVDRNRLTAGPRPTKGWDDYRTARVGIAFAPAGKVDLTIRAIAIAPGRRLMNLRSVRLTLVK